MIRSVSSIPHCGYSHVRIASYALVILLLSSLAARTQENRTTGSVISWGEDVVPYVPIGTSLERIAAGGRHSLALKSNGTVVAWGLNTSGESMVPEDLSGVVAVAAGSSHSLALKSDGTVVAWGGAGQSTVPGNLSGVIAIAAGGLHSLALKSNGTVVAWGSNTSGESMVPENLSGVVAIAAGSSHNLAQKSDGTVIAWGGAGQNTVPGNLSGVIAIAAGGRHSLALKSNGTVVAWGSNTFGESIVPENLSGVVAVAAGSSHSLALKSDGTVVAWGYNTSGQNTVPSQLSGVIELSAGIGYSLALKSDGTLVAWGSNTFGESTVPGSLSGVTAFAAGSSHSLALKSDGTVVAWGLDVDALILPQGLRGVVAVAAGFYHYLALKSDGTVVAWGWNASGQSTVPGTLSGVVAIAAGSSHNLAQKSDGTVIAWGENFHGQCSVPDNLNGVIAVAAGGLHSLALKSDGTVVAWGDNTYGQSTPPENLNGVIAVAAGGRHSLALKSNGTVVAWGSNTSGESMVPENLSGVVAIAAGSSHNLAQKSDGTVIAWGNNRYGQSTVPGNLTGIIGIAAGAAHCLALKSDGTHLSISNVLPSPVPARNVPQWLKLRGAGFNSGSQVILRRSATIGELGLLVVPTERTEYINSNELRIFVTLQGGSWTASVRNPDGKVSKGLGFNVVLPTTQIIAHVQGAVSGNSGQPLANATISAFKSGNGQLIQSANSGADGRFQFNDLPSGAYVFTASKPGYDSQTQLASVWDALAIEFRLPLEKPLVQPEKITELPDRVIPPKAQKGSLKIYYNGDWVSAENAGARDSIKANRNTLVLTHGWNAAIRHWPKNYAQQINAVMSNSGHPINIVGWDWETNAAGPLPPEDDTTGQGYELGRSMYALLGSGYRSQLHFIGHSLGTLANAYAANFLHGQRISRGGEAELRDVASPPWDSQNTHVTLMDEAEIARLISPKLVEKALDEALREVPATLLTGGAEAVVTTVVSKALEHALRAWTTRKSPLPVDFGWADNYVSLFGFNYRDELVTVCLRKSIALSYPAAEVESFLDDFRRLVLERDVKGLAARLIEFVFGPAHSYSWQWYYKTITSNNLFSLTDPLHLGFYSSFEYSLVKPYGFPDVSLDGTFWEQDHASIGEFVLVRVPNPTGFDCNCLVRLLSEPGQILRDFSRDVITGLPAATKVVGNAYLDQFRLTWDFWGGAVNYIGDKALEGSQKVVQLGGDAILRITIQSEVSAGPLRARNAQDTSAVVLPVVVPSRALFLHFDYTVSGDIKDDFVFFGINESNVLTLEGKFIPTNSVQTGRPVEVIGLAGSTNNLVFGLSGGTSTNCTVTVQAIRFILDDPTLGIRYENGQTILSWPANAANWNLEMTSTISEGEWIPPSESPILSEDNYVVRNSLQNRTRFYRLRRD
jgi:alpha-tubulin suppressor-like RCC1 family protein